MRSSLACLLLLLRAFTCQASEPPPASHRMFLPPEVRELFENFTNPGSCVQCSIGMCAANQMGAAYLGPTAPAAALLLSNSEYGPKVWHGSTPGRVESYCDARGIKAWNVTGKQTWEWMRWAARTGRFCAMGAGRAHFQTLYGWDESNNTWYVCNNNSPRKIDRYTWEEFQALHLASGQWIVILDLPPPPPPPNYTRWWD